MDEVAEVTVVIVPELENAIVAQAAGLSVDGVESLKRGFAPHFAKLHEMAAQANLVTESQPKQARVLRLQIKGIRTEAEKTRKELKADSLLRGKAIDGINNVLLYQLKPVEDRLEAIEKAEEIAAAKKKEELRIQREAALAPYVLEVHLYPVADMKQEAFDQLLANSKAAHEAAEKAKADAEAERLKQIEAARLAEEKRRAEEQAERERLKAEAEALRKEAEEARKENLRQQAAREVERQKQELQAKKIRDELEAKLKAEKEAAKKKQDEEYKKASDAMAEERAKREKLEQELAAKAKVEADKKAAEEKERKRLAKAGDKGMLLQYLKDFKELETPDLADDNNDFLAELRDKFMRELKSHIDSL